MQKLLNGIVEFRKKVRPSYQQKFAKLALGQTPDCLFFACADSRVVPNLFASTDPGDLFVVRNVGNLVPRCNPDGRSVADVSEAAAIEFALLTPSVRDIVVCGHSECGAMRAILDPNQQEGSPNLREWLSVGDAALAQMDSSPLISDGWAPHNRLAQINVLQQVENLRTYPIVRERIAAGTLGLHAWWFDLTKAEVLAFDSTESRFTPLAADTDEG